MSSPDFDLLLKQRIGLDAEAIGAASLQHVLAERQRICGLGSIQAYWDRVQADDAELNALIETVVVSETWFCRHPEAFAAMVRCLNEGGRAAEAKSRLLSLPCATGEEPASMVMALLDAGIDIRRVELDAIDISEQALEAARTGVYSGNAFRGRMGDWQARYFTQVQSGYLLDPAVRAPISYRRANLLDMALPRHYYDIIFCRNLLIYFDQSTQAKAIAALDTLLKPDGCLYVGPAESALLLKSGWISQRIPHAFAFCKPGSAGRSAQPPPSPRYQHVGSNRASRAPLSGSPQDVLVAAPLQSQPVELHRPASGSSLLREARSLADAGQLAQAEQLCLQYVDRHEPVAEAYYLLGLVNDASAHSTVAEAHYRKAIYLDPQHIEALVHLATLLEARGDRGGADRLHSRARRVPTGRRGVPDV